MSGLQGLLEHVKGLWGPHNLWAKIAECGHPGVVAPFTAEELRTLRKLKKPQTCARRECYCNAQQIAARTHGGLRDEKLQYVEGLVTVCGVPLDHAWVEYGGRVYDPTLAKYEPDAKPDYHDSVCRDEYEYFGVTVPKEEIRRHWLRTKVYSPLSQQWDDEQLAAKIWTKG